MEAYPGSGDRLGDRYTIDREIGRGGMAVVYLARDHRHNRDVALKLLRHDVSAAVGQHRFRQEIELAANLSHPHIVPVHDSGAFGGSLYYVMPHVDGNTLKELLEEGPLPFERALAIARDVGEALAYAHERGVIHRDIKPSNIMLTSGHAVVTDFGVALAMGRAARDHTASGQIVGTPGYMAPEQVTRDHEADARSDIYALGCVTYEMLVGESHFKADSPGARIAQQLLALEPHPSEGRAMRRGVVDAIQRAMALTPSDRFDTVTDFVDALEVRGRMGLLSWLPVRIQPTRREHAKLLNAAAATLAVIGSVALIWSVRILGAPTPADWPNGRPPSAVVLPMATTLSTEESRTLAASVAEDVTSELGYWDGIRAVPSVSLSGPMFDRGVQGSTIVDLDDAIGIARDLGVAAVVTITAETRADSARVQAAMFDVSQGLFRRAGRPVGRALEVTGSPSQPTSLAEPIARRVLGLPEDEFEPLASQRLRSRVPDALIDEAAGRRSLERWRLDEAERSFRSAIDLDPGFAMAHHRLAQTLYWQNVEEPLRRVRMAEEVAGASAAALRLSAGLPETDQAHIRAFHSFQEGDYEAARRRYDEILRVDSTDVYAWLLLGSVEYTDPWLNQAASGGAPRGSWNQALSAFFRAVELQPSFELGYGQVFDIYDTVVRTLDRGVCRGFEVPRGVNIPPWEQTSPENTRLFCLVALDSIQWVSRDSLDTVDRAAMEAGAGVLRTQAIRRLVRWSLYASDLPKPFEELARVTMAERMRYAIAPPRVLDSLATAALGHQEKALSLKGDTLAQDLFRLASLNLGAGERHRALELAEAGLALLESGPGGDEPIPQEAVNPFLSKGQVSRALALLAPARVQRYQPDQASGGFVPWGPAISHLQRARILGGAMVGGRPLREELDAISDVWSAPTYSDNDRSVLRRGIAWELAPALLFDDEALAAWGREPGPDDPYWTAMFEVAGSGVEAGRQVEAALATEAPARGIGGVLLQGVLSLRVGHAEEAIRRLNRIDSIPLPLDRFDWSWGVPTTSLLLRGDASMMIGDTARALGYYADYVEFTTEGDSLTAPLRERADARVRALRN